MWMTLAGAGVETPRFDGLAVLRIYVARFVCALTPQTTAIKSTNYTGSTQCYY
jgi:hypothetical protein